MKRKLEDKSLHKKSSNIKEMKTMSRYIAFPRRNMASTRRQDSCKGKKGKVLLEGRGDLRIV